MATIHQLPLPPRQSSSYTALVWSARCALCGGPMDERYDASPVRPQQFCCYHCAVKVLIPRRLDRLLCRQKGA
jgi:hypothetical protein